MKVEWRAWNLATVQPTVIGDTDHLVIRRDTEGSDKVLMAGQFHRLACIPKAHTVVFPAADHRTLGKNR